MHQTITRHLTLVAVLAICTGAFLTTASAQNETKLLANLKGISETPALSTPATGTFQGTISADGTSLSFELTYSKLVADSLFAHIHLGQKDVAGGVMIFLCDNSGQGSPRTCPTRGGTVSGTVTATDVIGPGGQGISPGQFGKVVKAIRKGVTYVNVHSVTFGAGEIRGQIQVVN